jgi:hypothetical protein
MWKCLYENAVYRHILTIIDSQACSRDYIIMCTELEHQKITDEMIERLLQKDIIKEIEILSVWDNTPLLDLTFKGRWNWFCIKQYYYDNENTSP